VDRDREALVEVFQYLRFAVGVYHRCCGFGLQSALQFDAATAKDDLGLLVPADCSTVLWQ